MLDLIASTPSFHCQQTPLPRRRFRPGVLALAFLTAALLQSEPAHAQDLPTGQAASTTTPEPEAIQNSRMDSTLFYQLLVGEIQARSGDFGSAYQIYLELARRHRTPELFKRAVEIALQARAGDEAMTAAKAWRQALPQAREPAEYVVQLALALGRPSDLADPLKSLIQLSPTPQQPQLIAALPRTLSRLTDKQAAARLIDEVTSNWRTRTPLLAEAWIASGEGWLAAGDSVKALSALEQARRVRPDYIGNGLLAISLMESTPAAEELVRQQLARPDAPAALRLTYARKLAANQRMPEAAEQLDALVRAAPDNAAAWLTLGAVRLELRQHPQAEVALTQFLALKKHAAESATQSEQANDDDSPHQADATVDQAYMLLSQLEEQRNQYEKALAWLDKVEQQSVGNFILPTQRARLLVKLGKIKEAREVIQALPEEEPRDAITKFQAEAQLLRDANQIEQAYKVMEAANARFPDDADLLYEQAMLGERLQRYDDMERLLRKAMALAPENPHNYNALGYSLADRNIRLDEARTLLEKALSIKPDDPFITDSMGWLEFRTGHIDAALRLLRQAYAARPDPEIAMHLGEVLWQQGQPEEAMQLWRKAKERDPGNEALRDMLKRLRINL